jgi:hypothetical protein
MSEEKFGLFPGISFNPELQKEFLETLKNHSVDDLTQLGLGFRHSPRAIRVLILMAISELFDAELHKYEVPNQDQFATNLMIYGETLGFISSFERKMLELGIPYFLNLSKNRQDQYLKSHVNSNSEILPSFEILTERLQAEKAKNSGIKTVLFHGKWNVPHFGYMLWIKNSLAKISQQFEISPDLLLPILVAEKNNYIMSAGKAPFLNTHWRLSLMSYLPNLKYLLPGGDIDITSAAEFWAKKYTEIKPDFIPVEEGDELTEKKSAAAIAAGVTPVNIKTALAPDRPELRVSSSSLVTEGLMDQNSFVAQAQQFEKTIGKSWRKKWF